MSAAVPGFVLDVDVVGVGEEGLGAPLHQHRHRLHRGGISIRRLAYLLFGNGFGTSLYITPSISIGTACIVEGVVYGDLPTCFLIMGLGCLFISLPPSA